ncbi:pyridoxamine 5'-phosphate oxidase family protein [Streptomyces sp. SID9727]|uniref:helix-turn-helix domain-containing protein n=1 Tax=Streptomyces sp. SID9727 TaxID=2706114 RepID=UPI0013C8DB03|nr:pyridoxamine 5'-phosphate oxidase family protein [Streptomyces sp. SID9727]NEC67712.1 helix-turn-helix domain-containing protein [Streptomyces sp. SID9727]
MRATRDGHGAGDLGRRAAARRAQLGLSLEEVADRAGSTPSYLAYVEEQVPSPGPAFLVRLADALETTVQDLAGFNTDLPQGGAAPGHHPRMEELDEAECWALLDGHGIGRIALAGTEGPVVFPVNYQVADERIVFVTAAESGLAQASSAGTEVAFELDRLDEAFSQGWSVLAVGSTRTLPAGPESERVRSIMISGPWAGDSRTTVVTLSPRRLTGRRILVPGAPGTATPAQSTDGG